MKARKTTRTMAIALIVMLCMAFGVGTAPVMAQADDGVAVVQDTQPKEMAQEDNEKPEKQDDAQKGADEEDASIDKKDDAPTETETTDEAAAGDDMEITAAQPKVIVVSDEVDVAQDQGEDTAEEAETEANAAEGTGEANADDAEETPTEEEQTEVGNDAQDDADAERADDTHQGGDVHVTDDDAKADDGQTKTEIDISKLSIEIKTTLRDVVALGEKITLTAELDGFDGLEYTVQWQVNKTGGSKDWEDVKGETGLTCEYEATAETLGYSWRLAVDIKE